MNKCIIIGKYCGEFIDLQVKICCFIAVSTTGFTTASLHIKGETSWFVASDLGFWEVDEQTPDIAENARVRSWVASGCPA